MAGHLSRGRDCGTKCTASMTSSRPEPISAPDENGTDGVRNLSRRATSGAVPNNLALVEYDLALINAGPPSAARCRGTSARGV